MRPSSSTTTRTCARSSSADPADSSAPAPTCAASPPAGPEMATYVKEMTTYLHAAASRFTRMDPPLITAINGTCAGAGMSLALIGDLALAGESSRFTMAYSRIGLTPDGSSTYFLPATGRTAALTGTLPDQSDALVPGGAGLGHDQSSRARRGSAVRSSHAGRTARGRSGPSQSARPSGSTTSHGTRAWRHRWSGKPEKSATPPVARRPRKA